MYGWLSHLFVLGWARSSLYGWALSPVWTGLDMVLYVCLCCLSLLFNRKTSGMFGRAVSLVWNGLKWYVWLTKFEPVWKWSVWLGILTSLNWAGSNLYGWALSTIWFRRNGLYDWAVPKSGTVFTSLISESQWPCRTRFVYYYLIVTGEYARPS
jgi:hypothetical protein